MSNTWSLSKVSTYEKCPAKYKYQYLDRLPRKTSISASRGIDKHAIMEAFIAGEVDTLPADLMLYEGFLRTLKGIPGAQLFPEVQLGLTKEWEPVEFDSPKVWWRGVLDLLVRHPDWAILYDWKTGKIYDDHSDQRELYALAVLLHHPEYAEIRCIHTYLDLGENREQAFHRGMLDGMKARWASRVFFLEKEQSYIPRPSYSCRYCSYSRGEGGPCRF